MLALPSTPIITHRSSITCLHKKCKFRSKAGSEAEFHISLGMVFKTPCRLNNRDRFVGVSCVGGMEKGELEIDDRFYMRRGVELARKATGCTSPNPMVGCVIVKDGKVVGEGFHPKAGQPHAEVFALRDAGDLAKNATAYVTLEPCNHYGRTPPCTEALIKAKVKKVVVGMVDPNPLVASKGVDRLRDAGIDVDVGIEEELCRKLNEAYIHQMLAGKPFVTLRYSLSMNGHFLDQLGEGAMASGGYYSKLLQESDAVVFSLASSSENLSALTSNKTGNKRPFQIIISRAHTPFKFDNISSDESSKVIIFTQEEAIREQETSQKGVEMVVCDRVSLEKILEYCKQQGLCNVLLDLRGDFGNLEELLQEGIDQKLLQKIVVEVLPQWSVESNNFKSLEKRLKIKNLHPISLGESVVLEGYVDI